MVDFRKHLTNESNWRFDKLTEEDKIRINKELEEASNLESMVPSHFKVLPSGKVEKMSNMIDPSDWNLGDIPEPQVLDDGEEVKVRITSVFDAETKSGAIPYWRINLEVPDKPLVKDFSFNLYKPHEGQTPKQDFNTKYAIQNMMKAFKLDMTRPFDPESNWIGEEAWAIVGMKEDPNYGKQNSIRKWILPK